MLRSGYRESLDEHICDDSTILFMVIFLYQPVFPTGRFFGRITQKGPSKNVSGRTNLWQNFGRIFSEMAEKGPNIKMFCFLNFSHMKPKKHRIFTDFGTGMI
jgi:hypothetical protein